jgi:hypothetical protein
MSVQFPEVDMFLIRDRREAPLWKPVRAARRKFKLTHYRSFRLLA